MSILVKSQNIFFLGNKMLTNDDLKYLENWLSKINYLQGYCSKCSKAKHALKKKLVKEALNRFKLDVGDENFDVSVMRLNKYVDQQKSEVVPDQKRFQKILKQMKGVVE